MPKCVLSSDASKVKQKQQLVCLFVLQNEIALF